MRLFGFLGKLFGKQEAKKPLKEELFLKMGREQFEKLTKRGLQIPVVFL